MDKKRLMILGSVEDFTKLTQIAVQRGIYTVVVDAYEGEAKKYASKAYTADIRDKELIDLICLKENIDHVLTSFSDNLFEQMVYISKRNHLPCFCREDKVRYLRNKILMKKMLRELNIPTANARVIDVGNLSPENINIPFPFVVKPLDGWGSKGTSIVYNYEELKASVKTSASYSTSGVSVMIEEINKGYEINVMSWIKNGEVYIIEFGDRETSGSSLKSLPYISREVFPSIYYHETLNFVKESLHKIADYIGIKEGPLSMQFFYSGDKIVIGEVAGRFFGLGQGIVPVINGMDINELLLNMVYNPDCNDEVLKKVKNDFGHCSVAIYLKAKKGIVRDLGNISQFYNENVDEMKVYAKQGESTSFIPWVARIYAHFSTREEADLYTKEVYEKLYVPNLDGSNLVAENKLIKYGELNG